jgi:hypothetical protein
MSATKLSRRTAWRPIKKQAGTAAVEFALLAVIFFMFVFGIIELARLLFVINTLHEVTRRTAAAAVNVYPRDTDATARVRQYGILRSSPGELVLGSPVTDQHVRLEYLSFDLALIPEASWPNNAAANRQICMSNPRAPTCIRFVQVRICNPAETGQCQTVTSKMMLPFIDLRLPFPRATTIVPAHSLGYVPGTLPPAPVL